MTSPSAVPSIFSFNSTEIRAFADEQGNPWFAATEICEILGFKNPWDAVAKHCNEAGLAKREVRSGGQMREMTFINEGNLYRLIIKSRKPSAIEFERNLMEVILPTIRKTGSYTAPQPAALPHHINPAQQNALQQLVAQKSGESGGIRAYIWSRFNNHFQLGSYKQLPAERFAEAVSYLTNMPVKETLPLLPHRYHFPRNMLEQPYFTTSNRSAALGIAMLGDTTQFVSPLMALLNQIRSEGHDISAPFDEAVAMREAIQRADTLMEEMGLLALKGRFKPASTAAR